MKKPEVQTPASDSQTQDEKDYAAGMGGSYVIGEDGKPVLQQRTEPATVSMKHKDAPVTKKAGA